MQFESFGAAQVALYTVGFGLAFLLGAVANKTNFCTMGGISDWVNMEHTGRVRAWLFAMGVAVLGFAILETSGLTSLSGSFPPYRGSNLAWTRNLVGGLLFGVGMTYGSGCANKTLVRLGAGNTKSLFVLLVIGITSYFMSVPFPGTDQTLYSLVFHPWMSPISIMLEGPQDIGGILGGEEPGNMRLIAAAVIGLGLIAFALKSIDFRGEKDNIIGGMVFGLAVVAVWGISATTAVNDEDMGLMSMAESATQWDMTHDDDIGKPADGRNFLPQSFTFVNPIGRTIQYGLKGFSSSYLTLGIITVFGVIFGSLAWALKTKTFRIEKFASRSDFTSHLGGAILMGIGGVLGMGCTVGQGITGISTLAIGSIITLFGIFVGCWGALKIMYLRA